MGSAREDFERFVRWLHLPETGASEDVRRFANLVLADFDAVAATARQHNNRAAHLARLARQRFAETPPDMPNLALGRIVNDWPWQRLNSLTVGPFRGFRREEPFDLRKRIVLIYGPNGSGKTSVCDALEYALLGRVQDAELKRLEQHQYLANIHARRFSAPTLTANQGEGRELAVTANPDTFRFCFIERNRIDAFARMASRPPGVRTELIATLFGTEKFSEFVNHFNDSLDPVLVLEAENERRLNDRRQSLVRDQQTVAGEETTLGRLADQEAAFAHRCKPGLAFAALKTFIGTREAPGRLQELEEALNAVQPPVLGITRQGLAARYEAADLSADRHQAVARQLEVRHRQVAYKDLYAAITALQRTESHHCPACETPIERVARDPFEKAAAGLEEFRELIALQGEAARLREDLQDAARRIRSDLTLVSEFLRRTKETDGVAFQYVSGLPELPREDRWWQDAYAPQREQGRGTPTLDDLLEIAGRIEVADAATREQLAARRGMIDERNALLDWQRFTIEQDLRRAQVAEDVASARARIAEFEHTNAQLVQRVEDERQQIARDSPLKSAHDQFLPILRGFRNQLPGMLMAGLNELARDLYNEFNDQDQDSDKLASLHLPLTGEQRIEIAFRGEPQRRIDALAVLSEGHIRCLGLAILLAKCISIRSPLVIFDDAVNAIDHDHRSGIRQVIFESERFRETQMIVTCHSNEFLKDIQNSLPQQTRNDWSEYVLRHHTGDHHPRVTANEGTRNYVARARAAKQALDDREALSYSRKGLEMLAIKIWRWLGFFDRGMLILEVDRPNGEPSLRNLCDAIRRKLDTDDTFAHLAKAPLLAALRRVLGIPGQNLIWTYLNKGTHEEENREDFDANLVENVVLTLEELDALDLRRPR